MQKRLVKAIVLLLGIAFEFLLNRMFKRLKLCEGKA